jgi:hypothetical protein
MQSKGSMPKIVIVNNKVGFELFILSRLSNRLRFNLDDL